MLLRGFKLCRQNAKRNIRSFKTSALSRAEKPTPVTLEELSESFMFASAGTYAEEMYRLYKEDPSKVHSSWATYFKNVESGAKPGQAFQSPPRNYGPASVQISCDDISLGFRVTELVRAYQVNGHLIANVDPLGIQKRPRPESLSLEANGFSPDDLDKEVTIDNNTFISGFLKDIKKIKIRDLVDKLEKTYCGSVGIEYMHIQDRDACNWLREKIETLNVQLNNEDRINLLDRLMWATMFEQYLATKFMVQKRFGIDGGESFIPALKVLIDEAAELGVHSSVIGMAHRGRMNVLANVVRKPLERIFHEFIEGTKSDLGSGDVKYHLGTSYDRPTRTGKKVHLSLVSNPSHLEAVNPVVEGKVKSKQFYTKDDKGDGVMSIIIHGDASFAGQGVVYESMTLSGLRKYSTGGTIHIVINNQIGFTTDPRDSRPGVYCTDVAKSRDTPIFHVNGDDLDALSRVVKIAAEWRQTFHQDVVIDIVCYRRLGHNEGDLPMYTQPTMYNVINKHLNTMDIYTKKLIDEGIIDQNAVNKMKDNIKKVLDEKFEQSKNVKEVKMSEWLESKWEGFKSPKQLARIKNTGVELETLNKVFKALFTVPKGFKVHKMLNRYLQNRKKMFETGKSIDWATAEALAFGTLALEGNHVRLAGQDVERGTFSHRHAVYHDQETNKEYIPLNNIEGQKAEVSVLNSFLSEFAALGFELGFSLESPNSLVLWEAQFGDFSNGAQIIIDQFLSSGEQKWLRQCGLVLLLPHGFEGQGPEHSSARIERFLIMSDSDPSVIPEMEFSTRKQIQESNWQVVNCTTPANYFHVLRRQIHREFRKPLIIFTPKSLLRHPRCVSNIDTFDLEGNDTRFLRVIGETEELSVSDDRVERVIFCSGKVYYDLLTQREKLEIGNIAIIRVEQLAPFPFDKVRDQLEKYQNAKDIVWCQEEPKNMGAWYWIYYHFKTVLRAEGRGRDMEYAGRAPSASPATGSSKVHDVEQRLLVNTALGFSPENEEKQEEK